MVMKAVLHMICQEPMASLLKEKDATELRILVIKKELM
ncbi:hypothetical protein FRA_40c09240 [Francisella sp. W12-1067]|nr:hypothetical protein FRA_40c09240 [Francisella sp. W12-1067]